MAKTRPVKQPPKASAPRQGSKGPVYTQGPRPQGGKPINKAARPAAKSMMKNASMKKPGSGTHGSGKGTR